MGTEIISTRNMNRIIEHREFRRDLSTASAYGLGVTLMTKYVLALAMILVSVVLGAQSEEKSLKSLTHTPAILLGSPTRTRRNWSRTPGIFAANWMRA